MQADLIVAFLIGVIVGVVALAAHLIHKVKDMDLW